MKRKNDFVLGFMALMAVFAAVIVLIVAPWSSMAFRWTFAIVVALVLFGLFIES